MQVNWERPITLLMILLKLVLIKIYFAAKRKKNKIKTKLSWGWWDHSVLKSLCCSGKGPGFDSQHPHGIDNSL